MTAQPHYHLCHGDCADGLTAATIERRESVHSFADLLFADGSHRYWSTHCRHGAHQECSASSMTRVLTGTTHTATVDKKPASCKQCGSPCVCPCHKNSTEEEA